MVKRICAVLEMVPFHLASEDPAIDSSGNLSTEFFDFLADKYEAAMNFGTEIMGFLESKRFASENLENLAAQQQKSVRTVPIIERLTPGEGAAGGHDIYHVDSAQMERNRIDKSDNPSSNNSSSDDSSSGSFEFTFPQKKSGRR